MAAMSSIALGAAAIGAGVSAIGTVTQGIRMNKAEQYNADVAEQKGEAIRRSTDFEIARRREDTDSLVSRQRALYAKAGVKFSGSPLTVMVDTIADAEFDNAILDYNAKVGISAAQSEAEHRRASGKAMVGESYVKAGSTLLQTGGSLAYAKWGD